MIEVGTCSLFSPLSFGGGGVEIWWPVLEITDERGRGVRKRERMQEKP